MVFSELSKVLASCSISYAISFTCAQTFRSFSFQKLSGEIRSESLQSESEQSEIMAGLRGFAEYDHRSQLQRSATLEKIIQGFDHVFVVEMNDQGLYGNGQLATLLRARFCDPRIRSITKTDGLTFKIREILAGIEEGRKSGKSG